MLKNCTFIVVCFAILAVPGALSARGKDACVKAGDKQPEWHLDAMEASRSTRPIHATSMLMRMVFSARAHIAAKEPTVAPNVNRIERLLVGAVVSRISGFVDE
ncbi:MAG: hypothetical protein AMJ75_02000 [Phycisphaerae bacterium SM1_79]|nr:MAG: hypothetical protein AMJ75_02000 [Phycisphaerae bacterium SM1_79]